MKKPVSILILLILHSKMQAQFTVQPQATLWIGEDVTMSIAGDVDNDGSFQNLGMVTFTGNWDSSDPNAVYNDGQLGTLEAFGATGQVINNGSQAVSNLIINNGEEVFLDGTTFLIEEELNLANGIVRLSNNTSLVIGDNANISGGSSSSFIEGTVVQRGTGERFFPLGLGSNYLPLTLVDARGVDLELAIGIGFFGDNGVTPRPDSAGSVIGVSDFHYWQLDVLNGSFIGSQLIGTFEDADLMNFGIRSEFNFFNSEPAIVFAPNVEGNYNTIRTENVIDTDLQVVDGLADATFGTIISVDSVNAPGFLAIGLVAAVPEEGIVYVPTAFSPVAINPDDRTFRVQADGINRVENFKVAVYNSFGVPVYETNDFNEANTIGWDGTHNGRDEPTGSYRYFVQFTDGNEDVRKRSGVVLLIR